MRPTWFVNYIKRASNWIQLATNTKYFTDNHQDLSIKHYIKSIRRFILLLFWKNASQLQILPYKEVSGKDEMDRSFFDTFRASRCLIYHWTYLPLCASSFPMFQSCPRSFRFHFLQNLVSAEILGEVKKPFFLFMCQYRQLQFVEFDSGLGPNANKTFRANGWMDEFTHDVAGNRFDGFVKRLTVYFSLRCGMPKEVVKHLFCIIKYW